MTTIGYVVKHEMSANVTGRGNQWLHVAGTCKQDGAARLYIDGAEVDVFPWPLWYGQNSYSYHNQKMQVGRLSEYFYYGEFTLDEWYFWDRELTGDQVKQIYDAYKIGKMSSN